MTPRRISAARAALAMVCAAGLALACGKQSTEPVVDAHLPPGVVEVFPAARATRVIVTSPIWVRFDRPLEPRTVTTRTVFLKIDTRRIPMTLSLTDSNRTIHIQPAQPLQLRRTHTVELTSEIHTQDGGAFADTYFWQFQTQSVRTPFPNQPLDGTLDESPVAPLSWVRSDSAGLVEYRLAVSTDSAAVVAGTAPTVVARRQPYIPSSRWASAATMYWNVRVRNLETGEESEGPVSRFRVISADAPKDSVFLPITDPGTYDGRGIWRCPTLSSGSGVTGIFRLDPSSLPPDLKVHEAGIVLLPQNFITPANFPLVGPFLEAMDDDWIACSARYPGAPPLPISGGIASGAQAVDGSIHYDSDAVAAHVQNVLRGAPNRGFIARSTRSLSYIATATTSGFRIVYYRPQGTIGGAHP